MKLPAFKNKVQPLFPVEIFLPAVEDLASIVEAFDNGMGAEVSPLMPSKDYMDGLKVIPGMREAVEELVDSTQPAEVSAAIEFILEGLHLSNKLNREVSGDRRIYK